MLDPEERKDLAETSEEGDVEALEELRAEHLEAIEAMVEALEDEESRELIKLGMMIANTVSSSGLFDRDEQMVDHDKPATYFRDNLSGSHGLLVDTADACIIPDQQLDMIEEQLEELLQNWSADSAARSNN